MPYQKMKYRRECKFCKKMFTTNSEKKVHCNDYHCKNKYYRLNNLEKGLVKEHSKTCVVCGKKFITTHPQKITCSDECNKKRKAYMGEKYLTDEYLRNHGNYRWYRLRFSILERDGFRCQYCGRTPQDKVKLCVDHIIPKSKGGSDNIDNLITSCEICNLGKLDVLLENHKIEKISKLTKNKNA